MMKILIAYDGSSCSDAALDDLARAGLPPQVEALVVSVAEVWLPPPSLIPDESRDETDDFIDSIVESHHKKGDLIRKEAERLVEEARQRLNVNFPEWNVSTKATFGSPSFEILSAARASVPDLIVVGSQGQSALGRFVLGSVSQKVLTEADCSVRVARGRNEVDPTPVRLIIGFDGTAGAMTAVRSVAARNWPADTAVRLVAATDSLHLPSPEAQTDEKWISHFTSDAEQVLRGSIADVSMAIAGGNPNRVLIEEAEQWHADCIFVGANAIGGRVERFLLGSTSAAVAARANCSVEVVRERPAA